MTSGSRLKDWPRIQNPYKARGISLLHPHNNAPMCELGERSFGTSPEDFHVTAPIRVLTQRFLDEKPGLAPCQPEITVADSLYLLDARRLDERRL